MKKLALSVALISIAISCSAGEVTVGSGDGLWNYPFHNSYFDSRTQTIYHSDEINASGYITGISYKIYTSSAKAITDFKIRIKQTSLDSYSDMVFDCDGWTVVYDGTWPAGSGWVSVDFECPYYYSGEKNLIIDVCYNRSKYYGSSYKCYVNDSEQTRTIYGGVNNSSTMDPQVWNTDYECGPTAKTTTYVPNVKLNFEDSSKWQHLGIMSFNIRGGGNSESSDYDNYLSVPSDGTPRRERIFEMIDSGSQSFGDDGPDIIGFQEVNNNTKYYIDGDSITNLEDLIQNLDDRYSWSGTSDEGYIVTYHTDAYNTIFYKKDRFNCKDSGTFWLSETPDYVSIYSGAKYNRVASWVLLYDVLTNLDYFVLNTHFSHVSDEARAYAAQVIMDKINELTDPQQVPVIVMGDMNSNPEGTPYAVFTGQEYQDEVSLRDFFREVYPEEQTAERTTSSYAGYYEGNRIDYILGYGDWVCKGAAIERGTLGDPTRYPSDHYPVTAHLYMRAYNKADVNYDNSVDESDWAAFCEDWLKQGYGLVCNTIDDDLIGYWSFDDAQSSGELIDGVVNGACSFDGIDDAIYSSANYSGGSTYEQVLNDWAITFWFKLDRLPSSTPAASYMMNIVGDSSKRAGTVEVSVRDNHKMRVELYDSSSSVETAYSDSSFVTNKWYHVAILYGSNPNELSYYINGELNNTVTLSNKTACWMGPLYIGKYKSDRYLDGAIDELRIYDRQLTEGEIMYLAAGTNSNGSVWINPNTNADLVENDSVIVDLSDWAEFSKWYGQ